MTGHEQVWVKVNTLVDRGVADLVSALSSFPRLRTIESCEGNGDVAWVCFVYGSDDGWKELAQFVFDVLGPVLMREFGDRVDVSIRVTESGGFRAEMEVHKTVIPALVGLLHELNRPAAA